MPEYDGSFLLILIHWSSVVMLIFSQFEVWLEIGPKLEKQIRITSLFPAMCSQLSCKTQ